MNRGIATVLLAALLGCSAAEWVTVDPSAVARSRERQRAGLEALAAGDVQAYLEHFRAAARLRPAHPSLVYHLARAYAMADSVEAAVRQLAHLAAMGAGGNLADDTAFSAISQEPGFRSSAARIEANAQPLVRSAVAFTAGDRAYLPEGLAYDPVANAFYLGSVHRGVVLRVGRASVDTVASRADGLWSAMGMTLDTTRGLLWIATSAVTELDGVDAAEIGRAAVLGLDRLSGAVRYRLEAPDDGAPHWFGDVTVAPDGAVYVSDSRRPAVYRSTAGWRGLQPVVVGPPLQSPQGLAAFGTDRLYLADYALGIVLIDVATGDAAPLPFPVRTSVLGIDGLYAHREGLIAIQNGFSPQRVLRLRLGGDGARIDAVEVLEANHPEYPEPTLGTIVRDTLFYVANADWPRFADGEPTGEGRVPVVLALPLR